ncbi:hypothetical protein BO71DRAFT_106015 [Aspergillus ellipticus CBS 707.79]|uniref:Secreted protein n=1 Tax=Aspergillus ellipticus CBS 707.79 TaxID=1448320 RepID=A0A319CW64_9EURO|nr:hypothetical protein BO71DRAFT_106015 [Aspergillus ellipticus CBS 707.79]
MHACMRVCVCVCVCVCMYVCRWILGQAGVWTPREDVQFDLKEGAIAATPIYSIHPLRTPASVRAGGLIRAAAPSAGAANPFVSLSVSVGSHSGSDTIRLSLPRLSSSLSPSRSFPTPLVSTQRGILSGRSRPRLAARTSWCPVPSVAIRCHN